MKRFKAVALLIAVFILLTSCGSTVRVQKLLSTPQNNEIEVKGLVLKYVLIDTTYELYQVNVEKLDAFSGEGYKQLGQDSYNHYLWLKNAYNKLDEEMKKYLADIFQTGIHPWRYMNVATRLRDDANVEDVVKALNYNSRLGFNQTTRLAVDKFFNYFYDNFLKDYLTDNSKVFDGYAHNINKQIHDNNPDLLGFLEKTSGISFSTAYKPVFYYTLRPIGAMGFNNGNIKISTLQRTCRSYEDLFSVPFHEFSHELFQTFTSKPRFQMVADELKSNRDFEEFWLNGMDDSYDWLGWCEENLVEGFSKYLEYKYYGRVRSSTIYMYDYDFYQYLKEMNFEGQKHSLEDASINFYKDVIRK